MTLSLPTARREVWLRQLIADGAIKTPCLVIAANEVTQVLSYFKSYLPNVKVFYAVKANSTRPLLEFLSGEGVSFDVASEHEINTLRDIGVSASRMILSNPVKSPATINSFFDNQISLVSVDSLFDLECLRKASVRCSKPSSVKVFVRIRITSTDVQIDLNSKFGCFEHEAVPLLKAVKDAGFDPYGIQFHVGTQSWNCHNYRTGIETSLRIIDEARRDYGILCRSINIGGGYPDPVIAKEAGGFESFFKELAQTIQPAFDRDLEIIAEPGRIVVSGACSSVNSIIGKNLRNGTPWLYLDDGTYGLYSGKFFDHKEYNFSVLQQNNSSRRPRYVPTVVAGPTCDSIDIISNPVMLPENLSIGDVVCSHNMGAYSVVTASGFNGFGRINTYLGEVDVAAQKPDVKEHAELQWHKVKKLHKQVGNL